LSVIVDKGILAHVRIKNWNPMPTSKLTDSARKVLGIAQVEARGSTCVGTHHILIALINVKSTTKLLLESYKLSPEDVAKEVKCFVDKGFREPKIGTTEIAGVHRPQGLSLRARNALQYAREIASSLNKDAITTRHILFGVFKERLGIGSQVLMSLNVEIDDFEMDILTSSDESNNPVLKDSLKIKRDYEARLVKLRITYSDRNMPFAERENILERITELDLKLITLKSLISDNVN